MAVLKRHLLVSITALTGVTVLAAMFVNYPPLDALAAYLLDTVAIVVACALILGLLNLLRVHWRKIRERQGGGLYSLVLLLALVTVLVVGLLPVADEAPGPARSGVQWIFQNVQAPIQASLSALMVFLIVSAAYRLLQIRSVESGVMLVVALLVLAGQVAVGLVPILPMVREWILDVPVMAGVRGILLGAALGALVTGLRLLLGSGHPYRD